MLAPAFVSALPVALHPSRPLIARPIRPAQIIPLRHARCRPSTPQQPAMSTAAKELRRRIASVQSAEKIVSSLRIVAAARIRASSQAALRARPFAEELQVMLACLIQVILSRNIDIEGIAHATPKYSLASTHGVILADPIVQKALMDKIYLTLLKTSDNVRHSHLNGRKRPVIMLTVMTADKGFCGPYNKDIISRTVRRIREMEQAGRNVELIIVGRIAHVFFTRHYPYIPVRYYSPLGRTSQSEHTVNMLSQSLLSEFIAGGVDRVEVIYTRFLSLISNAPSSRTLLPFTPTGIETVGDEVFQLTLTTKNGRLATKKAKMSAGNADGNGTHYNSTSRGKIFYDISDEEAVCLLNSMLPMYVTSQLMRIVREAIASEQASRLAAMTAATDNARELITGLQNVYNKERQARITREIIEVVSNVNI